MSINKNGFTLIEIIAVLVILGILAAVAIPKYMDIKNAASTKAAYGQIDEVRGRLNTALAGYMLSNAGAKPVTAQILVDYINAINPNTCPAASTTEGDFTFQCSSAGTVVTISITAVQGTALTGGTSIGTYAIQ